MTYYSAKDLARSFRTVRKNTIQIANDIPEDQYGFRPAPHTRTVGEMLAHIAGLPRWQQRAHGTDRKPDLTGEDFGKYMQDTAAFEKSLKTKADIVRALESEGVGFANWLEALPEETLAETVTFAPGTVPPTKSRFEMLMGVKEHEMHHRAQLMLVQRQIGQVPHLTREREARMARR
jgi:uncharacterized damage-inducible protein DinB